MTLDAEILLAHSAWLTRLARVLVVRNDEIDDVVQQTIAQALAQPPRHTGNVRAWLSTIARNVVRSKARSDVARIAREVAAARPPPIEDPAEAVERAELRRRVVEAVLALDEPYRSTLVLRFFEEMDVAAIGQLMETGEDTVRTRIRRGIIRVRERLERDVLEESRDSADRGAAARAILFVRLGQIAESGGGGTASAAAHGSRGTARGHGIPRAIGASRRMLVGAATVAVVAGGLWWSRASRSRSRTPETPVARKDSSADEPRRGDNPAPARSAERSAESAPPSSPETTPEGTGVEMTAPETGRVRGIITGPDGNAVAGALVWAIGSPSFEAEMDVSTFGNLAGRAADRKEKGLETANWYGAVTGSDGRYEIGELSRVSGWAIGAFSPTIGAMLSDVLSFDHEHGEANVDLRLIPGREVYGVVRDKSLKPIGGASVTLFSTCEGRVKETTIAVRPMGSVGEFNLGFQCGEPLEFLCAAPGYAPGTRNQVPFTPDLPAVRLMVTMNRRPGAILRGRIVDPSGRSLAPSAVLQEWLTTAAPEVQPLLMTVRAIPATADSLAAGSEAVDGAIDFIERMYDLVLPEDFRGRIELRIAGAVVGSAPILDLAQAPDLPCDVHRLPREGAPTRFVARFVDAESKDPIDIQDLERLPSAYYGDAIAARLLKGGSDVKQGTIVYGCKAGELTIHARLPGYAPRLFRIVVPEGGRMEPRPLELERTRAGVDGFVRHADGRPFGKAKLTLFRVTPEGLVDVTGVNMVTNPDGRFHFLPQAKGGHVIVASGLPDEAPGVARFEVAEPSSRIELRCRQGISTEFRVESKSGQETPPNTRFRIVDANGVTIEDSHREWPPGLRALDRFASVLPEGCYSVVVTRAGFQEAKLAFSVPAGDAILVNLEPVESRTK